MKLYSENFVDVIFGKGPFGFRIGETSEGYPILLHFSKTLKDKPYPLELLDVVKVGYFLYSINQTIVYNMEKTAVRELLKSVERPTTIRFVKPKRVESPGMLVEMGLMKAEMWDNSDDFLPIPVYDIRHEKEDVFTDRRLLSGVERILTPLYVDGDLFDCDIRQMAFLGLDSRSRSIIWKLLLRAYPYNPEQWEAQQERNISMYDDFIHEFITSRNDAINHKAISFVPSPLDTSWKLSPDYNPDDESEISNESKWSREFGDTEMREIIWKDVERTYSDHTFFRENKEVLARLLYVYGRLNSGIKYVQGMNELLAPLLYVFAEANESKRSERVSKAIEADTFFAFNNLMSETRDLFIRQMDRTTSGLRGVLQILESYLESHVPDSYSYLNSIEVSTEYYAVRWLTTLFAREFSLDDTCRVWDCFLADPKRFMFMYCVGCAMIQHVQDQLLAGDFAEDISYMQG